MKPVQNCWIFAITSVVSGFDVARLFLVATYKRFQNLRSIEIKVSIKKLYCFKMKVLKTILSSYPKAGWYLHFWQPRYLSYFREFLAHFVLQLRHIGQEINYLEYRNFFRELFKIGILVKNFLNFEKLAWDFVQFLWQCPALLCTVRLNMAQLQPISYLRIYFIFSLRNQWSTTSLKIKPSWGYPSQTVKFLNPFSSTFGVHSLILDIWPAPQVAEHWLQAAKSPQPGSEGASGNGGTPSGVSSLEEQATTIPQMIRPRIVAPRTK